MIFIHDVFMLFTLPTAGFGGVFAVQVWPPLGRRNIDIRMMMIRNSDKNLV